MAVDAMANCPAERATPSRVLAIDHSVLDNRRRPIAEAVNAAMGINRGSIDLMPEVALPVTVVDVQGEAHKAATLTLDSASADTVGVKVGLEEILVQNPHLLRLLGAIGDKTIEGQMPVPEDVKAGAFDTFFNACLPDLLHTCEEIRACFTDETSIQAIEEIKQAFEEISAFSQRIREINDTSFDEIMIFMQSIQNKLLSSNCNKFKPLLENKIGQAFRSLCLANGNLLGFSFQSSTVGNIQLTLNERHPLSSVSH